MHVRPFRLLPALGLALVAACHSDKVVGVVDTPLPVSLKVGDLVRLNVNGNDDCTNGIYHVARVEAIGDKSMILADTLNPTNGFTTADYKRYAADFDTLIYPIDEGAFGAATDIDNNGRIGIIFTRAVNELTPAGPGPYVGGFTYSRDLFPVVATSRADGCATSNQGEYFYALAPDPSGLVNGHKRSTAFVDTVVKPVLVHELQHLINASRKIYVNTAADSLEVSWLDEGLAHIAEELLFYRESGTLPRTNLDVPAIQARVRGPQAFNEDMSGNETRYGARAPSTGSYLLNPAGNSPYADNDDLSTRGAAWNWLRYLADQKLTNVTRSSSVDIELSGTGSVNVPGGTAGAEYYATLVNTSTADFGTTGYSLTPSNVTTPSPSLSALGGARLSRSAGTLSATAPALQRDGAFEARLRARERAMAPMRMARARAWYRNDVSHVEMPQGGRYSLAAAPITSPDGDIWFRLANGTVRGFRNLQAVLAIDPGTAVSDWAASHAVDDVSSLVPEQFLQKSWNWHNLLQVLEGAYTLPVRALVADTPVGGTLVPGGSTHFKLAVPAGGTGTLSVTSSDATGSGLRLLIVRTK
jgi:hypothetical protein